MACLKNNKDRVLVVDDQEEIRRIISRLISLLGYEVATAGNGREGLDLSCLIPFNLVITDLDMPEVDGLEALKNIIQLDKKANVVMITALGQKEQVLACIKAGAKDFIIKPFDQERVIETLDHLMTPLAV